MLEHLSQMLATTGEINVFCMFAQQGQLRGIMLHDPAATPANQNFTDQDDSHFVRNTSAVAEYWLTLVETFDRCCDGST